MTDKAPANGSDTPVAILHRAGGVVRGVLGRFGQPPALADSREFAADRPDEIRRWLEDHQAGSVIEVLPASAVVCRTCTLPDADPEQLQRALVLQAEAQMLTEVPPHRQARAVLPSAPGETARAGVMVAWPEHAGAGEPSSGIPSDAVPDQLPVMYAPDVAAVAALLNGQRPDEAVLAFDRRDGSVTLALSHANGAVLRAGRVPVERAGSMADAVRSMIAETALSVSHTPEFTRTLVDRTAASIRDLDREAGLLLPPDLIETARERLDGAPDDPRWWRDYGIAAGVFLAACGDLASLTTLLHDAPLTRPSRGRRLAEALSTPRLAARVVITCAVIVLFTPSLAAGLRLAVLKLKLADVAEYVTPARDAERRIAVYSELVDEAWPMTKLLADLACSTPESIDVDQIRVRHGRNVSVTGRARPDSRANLSAQEVVALMQDHLRSSDIFEDIYLQWGDPNNFGAYEFTLTARVTRPFRRYEYPVERDYGLWTYADRLYGEGGPPQREPETTRLASNPQPDADPPPPPADVDAPSPPPSEPRSGRENGSRRSRGGDGLPGGPRRDDEALSRGVDRPVGGNTPRSVDVPPPMTDEQIAILTLEEAKETLAHIAQARQAARLDEETKERLKEEFRKVLSRHSTLVREAREAGGGS